ncbi:hypothetical protein DFJ73DRAFT_843632 [Zopfochytrium polystomum]|nr:hypothetical protein DFJ73DRAFT_843632 [Zopfochytrium polystomum]
MGDGESASGGIRQKRSHMNDGGARAKSVVWCLSGKWCCVGRKEWCQQRSSSKTQVINTCIPRPTSGPTHAAAGIPNGNVSPIVEPTPAMEDPVVGEKKGDPAAKAGDGPKPAPVLAVPADRVSNRGAANSDGPLGVGVGAGAVEKRHTRGPPPRAATAPEKALGVAGEKVADGADAAVRSAARKKLVDRIPSFLRWGLFFGSGILALAEPRPLPVMVPQKTKNPTHELRGWITCSP